MVVKDHEGTANLLSLYNINIGRDDTVFLPAFTYIALCAPYYKLSVSGYYTLRSDHPSDILKPHQDHWLMKHLQWSDGDGDAARISRTQQDLRAIKEEGNRLFHQSKFHVASAEYSQGIQDVALVHHSEL